MATAGYAAVAEARNKALPSRLGLAIFLGGAAMLMAPSAWPVIWFIAMLIGQGLDWLAFRPVRLAPDRESGPWARAFCITSAAVNTSVYSAISIYFWFRCGEFGPVFAMIQAAGGLLHVSLHMHHARGLLLASVSPHAVYFLGLPILSLVTTRNPALLTVIIGALLYIAHLAVAVRQSVRATDELHTARAEAETQRDRAEQASAAKSEFLAVISHEIRTPMNAVISAAGLLRRTRLDSQQREHVAMLLDGGDVLMGLLNDVLDLAKIEAGKMRLEHAEMACAARPGALWCAPCPPFRRSKSPIS